MVKLKNKMSTSDVLFKIFTIILAIVILFPYVWLIATSLLTVEEYYSPMQPFFSQDPQFGRYWEVLVGNKFYQSIFNSILLAAIAVVQNLLASSFVAYGISRFKFKGRSVVFTLILATMFLPAQVTSIPKFLFWNELKLVNTYVPLVVPGFFGAATSILLISTFMKNIPKAMDEAAKIDGAGPLRIWWNIMLPQLTPILGVVALNTFLGNWKNSMGPLIYLRDTELYTVPLALLNFDSGGSLSDRLQLYVGLVIAIVPVTILFFLIQHLMDRSVVVADLK